MNGTLFDIQRFSLHDGPGIRTTVFLKGCPLRCAWCCNPESINPLPQLSFDSSKCDNCMLCVQYCKTGALYNQNGRLKVDFEKCNACGDCMGECPVNALKIYGYQASAEQVMATVMKDSAYFENTGGGLTISGGDPLLQFNFTLELLSRAKENGLNTCLETEGLGLKEQFEKLLPLVDYFYFDYKLTDNEMHKTYSGAGNKQIKDNLKFLCKHNANIVLRCIIIPGINDNDKHFQAIASLCNQNEDIREIHLMAYHQYGFAKYRNIGLPVPAIETKTVSREEANTWVKRLKEFTDKPVIVG